MEAGTSEDGPQAKHPKLEQGPEQPAGPQPQPSGDTDASGAAAAAVGAPGDTLPDMPTLSQRMCAHSQGSGSCTRPRHLPQDISRPRHSPSSTRLMPSLSEVYTVLTRCYALLCLYVEHTL